MKAFTKTLAGLLVLLFIAVSCGSPEKQLNEDTAIEDTASQEEKDLTRLNESIRKDSSNPDLFNQRARHYIERKMVNEALGDINTAIQLDAENPDYYLTLSDVYLAMGQGIKCEDALEKAIRLKPEDINALLKMGELNFILQDYKDAIKYLNNAIEVDPNNSTAYLIKGYSYIEAGDTARAIENFGLATEKDNNNFDAYMQLGLIFDAINNKLAGDYYQNALRIKPESVEALYAMALFLQNNQQIERAFEFYEKIISINPSFMYAYYNMGYLNLVYYENFEGAKDYFNTAIEIDPAYAKAYYNRGYCNELTGNYAQARKDYQRTMEIIPNFEKAIEGLNRLDKKQGITN